MDKIRSRAIAASARKRARHIVAIIMLSSLKVLLLSLPIANALLLQPALRRITVRPRASLHLSLTDAELTTLKQATRCLDQVGTETTKIGGMLTYYAMIYDPDVEGPPSSATWAKVKAKFPQLASASDEDLNEGLATLPAADYRDLVAELKATGTGVFGSKGGDTAALGAGAAPLAILALLAAAFVGTNVLGGGGVQRGRVDSDQLPPRVRDRAKAATR